MQEVMQMWPKCKNNEQPLYNPMIFRLERKMVLN
jgi:hypothetical protein